MIKYLRYSYLILLPILIVIMVNEGVKHSYKINKGPLLEKQKHYKLIADPIKCSWYCHQNTMYCKKHHTKILNPYFKFVDPIFFGIIKGLGMTGNYKLANILFLVLIWPLIMYVLLVNVLMMCKDIKDIKNRH